jgi:hypothetical protein
MAVNKLKKMTSQLKRMVDREDSVVQPTPPTLNPRLYKYTQANYLQVGKGQAIL